MPENFSSEFERSLNSKGIKPQATHLQWNKDNPDKLILPGDKEYDYNSGKEGLLDSYIEKTREYFNNFSLSRACYLLHEDVNVLRSMGVGEAIILNKEIQDIVKISYDGYLHLSIAGVVTFPELIQELTSAKVIADDMKINLKDIIEDDKDFVIKKFVDYVYDVSKGREITTEEVTNLRSYYTECHESLGIEKSFIAESFQNVHLYYEGKNVSFVDLCEDDTQLSR